MGNDTVKIDRKNAIKAYNEAPESFKKSLATLLGPDVIIQDIKERVKTFSDACEVLGLNKYEQLPFNGTPPDERQTAVRCFTMMIIIAEALNEGWVPDYSDSDQYKYYPYFQWKEDFSGFGFSGTDPGWTCANASVGARLSFKTAALAEYAGKQFLDIYNGFITLIPTKNGN